MEGKISAGHHKKGLDLHSHVLLSAPMSPPGTNEICHASPPLLHEYPFDVDFKHLQTQKSL